MCCGIINQQRHEVRTGLEMRRWPPRKATNQQFALLYSFHLFLIPTCSNLTWRHKTYYSHFTSCWIVRNKAYSNSSYYYILLSLATLSTYFHILCRLTNLWTWPCIFHWLAANYLRTDTATAGWDSPARTTYRPWLGNPLATHSPWLLLKVSEHRFKKKETVAMNKCEMISDVGFFQIEQWVKSGCENKIKKYIC